MSKDTALHRDKTHGAVSSHGVNLELEEIAKTLTEAADLGQIPHQSR